MRTVNTKLAITGLVLGGVAALTTMGTLALFTASSTVGTNTFSTGTIDLTSSPSSAVLALSHMVPGDLVTDSLTMANPGTEPLRYSLSSVATNNDSKGLKDQLVLTVKTIDVTSPSTPCDDFDGTQLYTGDLDSTDGKILGDAASGQDGVAATGGDRSLGGGLNEVLCFRVSLPSSTGNAFQGATSTATFTFNA